MPMWQTAMKFENLGGKIKLLKETSDNCYEVYGYNSKGQKVEIYYDPATGNKIKENIK